MTEVAADPLGVGRREGVAGLGQPVLEGGALSFGRDGPGPELPEDVLVGRTAEARLGRLLGTVEFAGPQEVIAEAGGAVDDGLGHDGNETLLVDPVITRTAEALEGAAADQFQGLDAQGSGRLRIDPVGLPDQALEGGPVTLDPLEEVAAGTGGVGQVLGSDPTAQAGQIVVDRLARHIASGPAERPHAERDLVSTEVVRIVTDEIGGEGFEDRGPTARREPDELAAPEDVDGKRLFGFGVGRGRRSGDRGNDGSGHGSATSSTKV